MFTTGFNATVGPDCVTWPSDCWGLDGNGDIAIQFEQPMSAIAAHFPGFIEFALYWQGTAFYSSNQFGGSGFGFFGGLVSTQPFDMVVIADPTDDSPFLDNLYFGPPIPAPGAIGLFACAAFAPAQRRRRR